MAASEARAPSPFPPLHPSARREARLVGSVFAPVKLLSANDECLDITNYETKVCIRPKLDKFLMQSKWARALLPVLELMKKMFVERCVGLVLLSSKCNRNKHSWQGV